MGLFLLAAPALLGAQVAGKKALDHDSYDIWKTISGTTLANNGEWIAFVTSAREADGVMTLRSVGGGNAQVGAIDRASGPSITPDSRFLIFTIDPMQSVVDSLEEADADSDEMPTDSLGWGRLPQHRLLQGGAGPILQGSRRRGRISRLPPGSGS